MGGSYYKNKVISAWEFNEASNSARLDSKSTNHLTDNNTVPTVTGVATNDAAAARFVPGNFEFLSRTNGTIGGIENKTDNFSIEMAFKLNATGITQTIIAKGATSDAIPGFWCFVNTSNRFQITLGNGTGRVSVNPTNVLTTATLYHFICTCDRAGNMSVYLNNALGTGTGAAAISGITGSLGNTTTLTIGQTSSTTYLSADVGFVRFWNGVLSSTERTYLYNSGALRSYAQL